MNKSKILLVGGGVLLLIVIGSYSGFFKSKGVPGQATAQREAILKQDRKNLERKDANSGEVRAALMRLSSTQDPLALEQALARVSDPSPEIRGAVAFAVGRYLDPKADEALKKLLADTSADVRRDAIRGAGSRADDSRRSILEVLKDKKDMTPAERVALWEVLLKWDVQGKLKGEAAAELIAMVKSADPMVRAQSLGVLVSKMRDDSRVVGLLKDQFQNSTQPSDRVMALHHLVSLRDPWVLENFQKFTVDSNLPELQSAGLQLMAVACPSRRWELIEARVLDPKSPPNVRMSAVYSLRSLGGAKAYESLSKWIESGKLSDPVLGDVPKKVLEQLEKMKTQPERCEARAAAMQAPGAPQRR